MTDLHPVTIRHSELTERGYRLLFYEFLRRGIRTDDELHFFIWCYLGYNVPRRAVCPHHTSPFSFIADQYFERHNSVIGFANRTGGKTLDVAILNVVEMLAKSGIEIVTASADLKQTEKGYEYVRDMFGRLTTDGLLGEQDWASIQKLTQLFNGSILRIVSGTIWGMNGPHPNKVRIDEIDMMWWPVLSEALSMSVSSSRYAAGDCFTSTRKWTNGTMQRMLDEAEAKNFVVKSWCIWDVLEPCKRQCKGDPVYGDCPAFSRLDKDGKERVLCGGKAHDLPPGGFYKIDDFVKKIVSLDWDTWETQWLNLRPSGGALVYGNFYRDEAPFVVATAEAEALLKRAREEKNWPRVIGVDFGANFYVGYCTQDPKTGIWYVYNEYWSSSDIDVPLKTHAGYLKEHDLLGWSQRTPGFGDPSGRQAMRDLEEYGIFLSPANNAVYEGISFAKKLFELRPDKLPGLRIFSRCVRLRAEVSQMYIHPLDKNGQPLKDKILKRDDHGCDATLRYALYSYATIGTSTYKMVKLRGMW